MSAALKHRNFILKDEISSYSPDTKSWDFDVGGKVIRKHQTYPLLQTYPGYITCRCRGGESCHMYLGKEEQ